MSPAHSQSVTLLALPVLRSQAACTGMLPVPPPQAQVLSAARDERWFDADLVTEALPPGSWAFHAAEARHQRFYACNPGSTYCCNVVAPKLRELRGNNTLASMLVLQEEED